MNDMIGLALGAALGAVGMWAANYRAQRLLKLERQRAAREMEGARGEAAQLREALRYNQEQLDRGRMDEALRVARDRAWMAGYEEGIHDGSTRRDVDKFVALFEKNGGAALMIRQRRTEHAGYGG